MDIKIIGVPVYYGSDLNGSELGPKIIREKGLLDIIKKNHNVTDLGDVTIIPATEEDKTKPKKGNILYFDSILAYNTELAEKVAQAAKDSFVLTVGGDHSLGIGSISGMSHTLGNDIAVIWVDAHGDINTPTISQSHRSHGMPLSFLLKEDKCELSDILYFNQKIKHQNVYEIGQRDLDKDEEKLIEERNITLFTMEDTHKQGITAVLDQVHKALIAKGTKAVHLSFDIDFVDKALVPGTGTPVDGGASVEQAKELMRTMASWGLLKSMDFAEVSPGRDVDGKTVEISMELLEEFFAHLK